MTSSCRPTSSTSVRWPAPRSSATWRPWPARSGKAEETRDSFPWEAFRGLAGEGCFAVPFPEPHGAGLEHPMLATCLVTEEIAYESSSIAGVYDGQCILNARALSFAAAARPGPGAARR